MLSHDFICDECFTELSQSVQRSFLFFVVVNFLCCFVNLTNERLPTTNSRFSPPTTTQMRKNPLTLSEKFPSLLSVRCATSKSAKTKVASLSRLKFILILVFIIFYNTSGTWVGFEMTAARAGFDVDRVLSRMADDVRWFCYKLHRNKSVWEKKSTI